jgi:hypothetical protein
VKQAAEYLKHAEEARQLAASAKTEAERGGLLQIAQLWESLARHRERETRSPQSK